ncbi:MAG: O-antigen ligase family protein [Flavisolibacter sp.]
MIVIALAALYLQQPVIFFLPAAVLLGFFLLKKPQYILYVLTALIPWSSEVNVTETLSTDLPDEPLMLLGSVAALALFVKNRKNLHLRHPLLYVVLLQFAWMLFTVSVSAVPLLSFKYALAKSWYLLCFLALPLLMNDFSVLKRSFQIITISTLVVTTVVVVRHAGYQFHFSKINDAVTPFFRNHVVYSSLLVCTVPLLWLMRQMIERRSVKKMLTILLLFTVGALFFSYARGAWLALAAGTLTYFLIRKKLLPSSFLIAVLCAIAAVTWLQHNDNYLRFAHDYRSTIYHEDFEEHLAATYAGKDVSTAERFYRWVAGVRMVREHWWTGTGPSSFYSEYRPYTVPLFRTWVSNNPERSTVHNYFLLTFIEQGLIGFILLIFLLALAFHRAQAIYHRSENVFVRRSAAAVAVILVMIVVVNLLSDLIETDKIGSVFYLCIAAVLLLEKQERLANQHAV